MAHRNAVDLHSHYNCSWASRRVLFFTPFGLGLCLDPNSDGGGGGGGGGEDDAAKAKAAEDEAARAAAAAAAASGKSFTQADLDRVVAKQRRELNEKHLEEINRLKKAQGLTDEERKSLEKRSAELEDALLSEKDRARNEIERTRKEALTQVEQAKKMADQNWALYTSAIVSTEISTAAAKHKAFNPTQIDAIVRPMSVVEEEKDEALKPTGRHIVLIKVREKDDKGVVKEVKYSVDKYIEKMRSSDEFANLFLSERQGGMGYRPGSKGSGGESKNLSATQKIAAGLSSLKKE